MLLTAKPSVPVMLSKFFRDFTPKSLICFREGYSLQLFWHDLFAGLSVGVIALPLALAFAIGSGVAPERGLYTVIIAGFLISLLGGSRVQIGGPTGAYVVIVYAIVQKYGYEGLAIATLIAGGLMLLMGLFRFGVLLKFIPYPVTTGFTTGIALVIFISQVKDLLGLHIDKLPPEFIEKCTQYCHNIHTLNPWALTLAVGSLILIFLLRRFFPKFPGAICAIVCATLVAVIFHLPVETIGTRFGEIPRTLPIPSFPDLSLEKIQQMFPDAITIALLGAIESLLSAVVADGITGHRHRSNTELAAQGVANVGSVIFGGIPATGAIARTSANIRMGARTPVAGMVHAVTMLLLMLFFAPYATLIPLSALSAVLVYVAWNMSELPHFIKILKGPRSDALVLITTFLLTVLIDLTVAVQVGVILAAMLFLKHLTDATTIKVCNVLLEENAQELPENHDSELLVRNDIPEGVTIFEIKGPFFYSVADQLDETLRQLPEKPRVFILRMRHVPLVDTTGAHALCQFAEKCRKQGIVFILSGVKPELEETLRQTGVEEAVGREKMFPHIDAALATLEDIKDIEIAEEARIHGKFVDWKDVRTKLIKKHGFTDDEFQDKA